MFKHLLIKRSLAGALVIAAASVTTVAQARPIEDSRSAPVAPPSAQVVSASSLQQPSSSGQSSFQWGDAGIGAAGAAVLLGAGALGTSAARRRRRPVVS
jgi:hypothetical protein